MTRSEHLAWCKQRALEYVDSGDLANAAASMGSDLRKHEAWQNDSTNTLLMLGLMEVMSGNVSGVRRWIEGFN